MSEPALQVAIGTTSLIRPVTGIGRYTMNLVAALAARRDLELRYFYGYEWDDVATARDVRALPAIKRWMQRLLPNPYEVGRFLQNRRFRSGVRHRRPDVYHEPNFLPMTFAGPTVLTIHDLSYLRYPETHPELRVRVMHQLLPPAIDRAAHLLTDSEFTRREVIDEFGVAPDRVTAALLGVEQAFAPRDEAACRDVLTRHGLTYRGYVLAVGTLEPRKNLVQVIRAYAAIGDDLADRFPLVIAGGRGWKTDPIERELESLVDRRRAVRLGYVPDAELPVLYSAARAVVFPSLYEGFGLPAAEAMASGVPLIASDRSSVPEVVADAALLVSPDDVDGMRDALRLVLEDDARRADLARRGLERAKAFSWAECARQTAAIYRRVAGRG